MHTQAHRCGSILFAVASIVAVASCAEPIEDQLPLSAALDYVQQHPEYFIADPSAELLDADVPKGRDAELDRHLTGDWVARTVAGFDGDDEDRIDFAWQSITAVSASMFSQRHPNLYLLSNDCVCDEGFEDATFVRLVRGFGNCDAINYLLAVLLSTGEPGIGLRHIDDSPDGRYRGGHTIAVMRGHDGPIFADAWADFGLMVLSSDVAPGVATHNDIDPGDDQYAEGIYARVQYELSGSMRKLDLDFGPRHEQGPDLTIPEMPPVRDARDAYLRARVLDLYGLSAQAMPLYQQAADMTCHSPYAPICQLASAFLSRADIESRALAP